MTDGIEVFRYSEVPDSVAAAALLLMLKQKNRCEYKILDVRTKVQPAGTSCVSDTPLTKD